MGWVGSGLARVRSLFADARKHKKAVIFIDEIDAVATKRSSSPGQTNQLQALNQLLVEMDSFKTNSQVIVLAATNVSDRLDLAIMRPGRFDHTLVLSPPDINGRRQILKKLLANIPAEKISEEVLAQNLAQFHEAGHALVALATPGSFPVHQATIVPRNNALGLVLLHPDVDLNHMSKAMIAAKIDMALGGFMAEEIKYGAENISTGPSSDLKTVNTLAKQMVISGFGKRTGFFPLSEDGTSSQAAKESFKADIKDILSDPRYRVRKTLTKNEVAWRAIATALMEHETLNREQLEELYRK